MLAAAAVPAVVAALIAVPLIAQPEIPSSAANPNDRLEIEYEKHDMVRVSHGITERIAARSSEILSVDPDGGYRYTLVEDGIARPEVSGSMDPADHRRLAAVIKETGFAAIPDRPLPVRDDVQEYERRSLKITLNGAASRVQWPEQNATDGFIPPIVTLVQEELDAAAAAARDRYK